MRFKNVGLLLFAVPIFLYMLPLSSGAFTLPHEYWSLEGIRTVNSPIIQECVINHDYKHELVDGNNLADSTVLFYLSDSSQNSYVFSHQKGAGYNECLERAGTNIQLKCECYGIGMHIVQDHFWHNEDGMVPKYLKTFGAANLFGHMVVEKNAQDIMLDLKKDSVVATSGDWDFYDSRYLDTVFIEGADGLLVPTEVLGLINQVAGRDMANTVRTIQAGYKGNGFFNTVYKDRIKLPGWAWGVGIGLIVLGLVGVILLLWQGTTRWKYWAMVPWVFVLVIGAVITISFMTGTTWKLVNTLITIPPKFGYLDVSTKDVIENDAIVQTATNEFLRTGVLPFDDASGLTYIDSQTGQKVIGALPKAQRTFQYVLLPIMVLVFLAINILLLRKAFGLTKKKR